MKNKKSIKFFIIIKKKSQRIKSKNFLKIKNLELYKYLLNELKGEKVFVDTDSNKIIDEAKKNNNFKNFIFYKRDKKFIELENSKNYKISPVYLLIKNFLDKYCHTDDIVVTSHVTSPFIKKNTIYNAIEYLNKGYDSVSSATFHNEFALIKKNDRFKNINFNYKIVNKTQDLEPIILLNGAFFIFSKKTFIKNNSRFSKKHYFYKINYPESIDINYPEDVNLAKNYVK